MRSEVLRAESINNSETKVRDSEAFEGTVKSIRAAAFVDALTGSRSNLHPRHRLNPPNALPKLLEFDLLVLKLPFDLLYRLLLPNGDLRVSLPLSIDRLKSMNG